MNKAVLRILMLFPAVWMTAAAAPVPRANLAKEAEIVTVGGEGWVRFPDTSDWLEAEREQNLTAGDVLRTGDFGRMGVLFVDGVQIKLSRKTTLAVKAVANRTASTPTTVELQLGEIWSRAKGVPGGVRVQTPSATAAIRGTDWDLVVDEKGASFLTVLRGSVDFFNEAGSLLVEEGQQAMAEIGKAPSRTFLVQPRERVQWVFSYALDVGALVPFHSPLHTQALAALPAARTRAAGNPADIGAKLALAGALYDCREFAAARATFDEVLAAEPANATALAYRGLIDLRLGNVTDALASFEAALAADATNVEAALGSVGALASQGRLAEAAGRIEALSAKPEAPAVTGVVATAFQAFLGDFTGAAEMAAAFAGRFSADDRFPTLLASIHVILDDSGKAETAARHALTLAPESAPAHTALGQIHHLEGRGRDAEESFRKAIELDPGHVPARNALALVRGERGFFDEAREGLSAAIELAPDNALLHANRGFLETLVENLDAARADYATALGREPSQVLALSGEALVALKEGRLEEAIDSAMKASLVEPRLAQPHAYLAIAFYQDGQINRALQEIELAAQLDPNDPTPHLLAYIIHQDNYRPFAAIQEAKKVLDRLPYLKSVDAVENTRQGTSNLGSALLGFGLPEWAESYAQEAFNPHNASSHFQASRRYNTNHSASVSELVQGIILDPLASSHPTRFQDLVRRPRSNLSLAGTWGDSEGGALSQQYQAVWQGYTRTPWGIAWSFSAVGYDNDGSVPNGASRGGGIDIGIGVKPDFNNGFTLGLSLSDDDSGQPGSILAPDPDNAFATKDVSLNLGYRHRFGPRNHLLARVALGRHTGDFSNPAPFGTGLTDIQASFLFAGYDFDVTRGYFQQGVYDISGPLGGPGVSLATDATGNLATVPGALLLPSAFPEYIDLDLRSRDRRRELTRLLQVRHMIGLGDRHEFTYGADFVPLKTDTLLRYNEYTPEGEIDFYEEPFLDPDGFASTFQSVVLSQLSDEASVDSHFFTAYVDDRWKPHDRLLLEGGLFFESFHDDFNSDDDLHPRIAAAVQIAPGHLLRLGSQSLVEKASMGTLAPVSTAGLLVDDTQSLPGARVIDHQARWESRWSGRLFTVAGVGRSDIDDPELGPNFTRRELRIDRASIAMNAIVSEQLSAFAYHAWTDAEVTGGGFAGLDVPRIPRRSGGAGLVWISPRFFRVSFSHTYLGSQAVGFSTGDRLPGFWTSGLSAGWEPMQKRLSVSLSIENLFNEGFPAPARSAFFSLEGRF